MTEAALHDQPMISLSAARPPVRDDPVRRLQVADTPALSRLLRSCFPEAPAGFASGATLMWKYFPPPSVSDHGLSCVVERDGVLLAHAGLCPATFVGPGGDAVESGTIIDWAADSRSPGAGLVAYRHLMRQHPTTFLIGGTPTTRRIAAALGFRPRVEARVYSRWLRPLSEFLVRPKSWRSPLRLLHGVGHALVDPAGGFHNWSVQHAPYFDDDLVAGLRLPSWCGYARRTAAELNHRLCCPTRATRGFFVRRGVEVIGYALVSLGTWDAKILDLRIESTSHGDWAAAYSALTDALARERQVTRVSALASVAHVEQALQASGFWRNGTESVSFFDPSGALDRVLPLDIQFYESDLGYYDA